MSHMVIHTPADGTTQYRQFDDLGSAVQFVEEQRNAGVEDAALFEMREIPLAVKSYFKVEVAETSTMGMDMEMELDGLVVKDDVIREYGRGGIKFTT